MSGPVLAVVQGLAGDPGLPALAERLRQRGTRCVVLEGPATPRALLALLRGADIGRSWLASTGPAEIAAAATAGLAGVVLVGCAGDDRDEGILVRHAPDLAGATIAMVPRGGGCWHDGPAAS